MTEPMNAYTRYTQSLQCIVKFYQQESKLIQIPYSHLLCDHYSVRLQEPCRYNFWAGNKLCNSESPCASCLLSFANLSLIIATAIMALFEIGEIECAFFIKYTWKMFVLSSLLIAASRTLVNQTNYDISYSCNCYLLEK